MAWISKGERVAAAQAEAAAERGEDQVLRAQASATLMRARRRLESLATLNPAKYSPAVARVVAERGI